MGDWVGRLSVVWSFCAACAERLPVSLSALLASIFRLCFCLRRLLSRSFALRVSVSVSESVSACGLFRLSLSVSLGRSVVAFLSSSRRWSGWLGWLGSEGRFVCVLRLGAGLVCLLLLLWLG